MHKITTFIPLFVILSFFNFQIQAQNWDIEMLENIDNLSNPNVKRYSTFISETTTIFAFAPMVSVAVAGIIRDDDQMLRDALYLGTSCFVGGLLTYGMKLAIDRPRPYISHFEIIKPYKWVNSSSMPSGHTSLAFSSATSLSLQYPKWYVIAPSFLWAGSVGFSRMNLGVHYPSDVLAGAALGAGSAYLTFLANKWFWKKHDAKKSLQTYLDW